MQVFWGRGSAWQRVARATTHHADHLLRRQREYSCGGWQGCGDQGLEVRNVVVVGLRNNHSGYASEHAVKDIFGQVVDVVLRRIHYANALLVAAGHDEKMPAGEEVIVTVGDAHVDD